MFWGGEESDRGKVIEVNPNVAVRIEWTTYPQVGWLDCRDMKEVSKVSP